MYQTVINDMDLSQLALSGQCFRMKRTEGRCWWSVAAADRYVEIFQEDNHFTFSCGREEFETIWHPYFDLDTDYCRIKSMTDHADEYLQAAIRCGGGVRILRQDLWEMIITFLISQNNNITRITNSVEALCRRFGAPLKGTGFALEAGGLRAGGSLKETDRLRESGCTWDINGLQETEIEYSAFPTPESLAAAGLDGLAGSGLGYRDKYIAAMAERCCGAAGQEWLETVRSADYETAHEMLMEELGIGKKVADCVCLFGLHHVEAFPVDTHVKQIVKTYYPQGFPLERYHGYAGILQQYLFFYKVNGKRRELAETDVNESERG